MKNENDPAIEQEQHERLCAYVFGELAGDERTAFERELLQSPALRAERARLEATIGLVKRAIPDEGLSHAGRREVVASARRSRFRFLRGRTILALAAACVLLLGGALVVRLLAGEASLFTHGIVDEKVASRPLAASAEMSETVDARQAKATPEDLSTLRGLGYSAVDRKKVSAPAAAPQAEVQAEVVEAPEVLRLEGQGYAVEPQAPSPQVQRQLDQLGYGDGATVTGGTAIGVGSVAHESGNSVNLAAVAPAKEAAAAQGERFSAGAPGVTTLTRSGASTRARASMGPATSGPASPGAAPSGVQKSADGFLAHGLGEAKGTYRGPGDSVSPGSGGRVTARSGLDAPRAGEVADKLEALGYGGDDDDQGEHRDEERSDSGRKPIQPLTREQVKQEVDRLLTSTRPGPGESPRDMFFRYWGDAPFTLAREEATSTFAVDVDTASYALARSYLNSGQLPPRAAVRTEEFVNYFKADQPPPSDGKPFAIGLELAPSLFSTDTRAEMLRVSVRAKDVADFERQPLALTFVLDNSGSMQEGGRLELVKRALGLLLRQLYAGDSVAVVKFSNEAAVVTPPLAATRRGELESLIQALPIAGGTNVEAGLRRGYDLAVENLQPHAVNRVILCSDGVGNIGETTSTGLLALVKDARAKGIYLNTVGVGMGNHNDAFLEQLADQGDGVCNYVDSDAEAKRVFVDGLASALQPVARDVKLQVEFDPAQVESWRLLGYENRALEKQMFRDDAIDAGEVNAGHQVSALYELVRLPGRSGALATVRLRYKPPFAVDQGKLGRAANAEAEKALELERTIASVEARPGFQGATNGYQRAVLVAQFAEVLRDSVHARGDSLATLVQESKRLEGGLGDPDFTEFVALLAKANPLLDARAKQLTPKVQPMLDELAQLHFELARGERMRQLETDAADKAESAEARLEERLAKARDDVSERDAEVRRQREEEALRKRIQELEAAVRVEIGTASGLAPAEIEALKTLGY